MLNRRILRVKAMQSIYAFKQAKRSNYYVAQDYIKERFLPDLNSMEFQDKEQLKKDKSLALEVFEESYVSKTIPNTFTISTEVEQAVKDAITHYFQLVDKDLKHFGKMMLFEAEQIYNRYISIFGLLIALARKVEQEKERKLLNPNTVKKEADYRLADNQLIQLLSNTKSIQEAITRTGYHWHDEDDIIKQLHREIKTDETYLAYLKEKGGNFTQEKAIVDHILRTYVFKKNVETTIQDEQGNFESKEEIPFMYAFFEDKDLNWTENREIVKSMVLKTIKNITEIEEEQVQLVDLSPDWETDKAFFVDLYYQTLYNEEEYEQLISEKTKNWKADRLALVDKVILEMAMTEIIHCHSIPVKVSIKEYIELSKKYSTPKSKQFVNGLLDVIANDLVKKGKVKKSGRGLIDNK